MSEKLCTLRTKGGGGAKYTETSLWTNQSPSSNFAEQTVTLSEGMSNFKYIAVDYKGSTSGVDTLRTIVSVEDLSELVSSANNPQFRIGGRITISGGVGTFSRSVVKASDTTISFSAAYATNGSGSNNSAAIPLEILGLNELAHGTVQTATGTFTTTRGSIANYTINLGFRPRFIAVYFNGATGSMSGSTAAAGSSRCIYDASVNSSYTFRDYKGGSSYVTMAPIDYNGDTKIAEVTDTGFVWRNASSSDWAGKHYYFAIGSTTE